MKKIYIALLIVLAILMTVICVICISNTRGWRYRNETLVIYNQKGLNEWRDYCLREENLKQVQQLKNEMRKVIVKGNPSFIPETAFANCPLLEEVSLPDTIEVINDHAFDGDQSLKRLTWPKCLIRIGKYSFRKTGFVSITFPKNLTHIGNFAFFGLKDLKVIELPDSMKEMDYAFSRCPLLETVHLGCGLSYLGDFEFTDCPNLHYIFLPSSITELKESPLKGSGIKRIVFEGKIDRIDKLYITENDYPLLEQIVFLASVPITSQNSNAGMIIDKPNVTMYITNQALQQMQKEEIVINCEIVLIGSIDELPPLNE